jgi:hypothetical protein
LKELHEFLCMMGGPLTIFLVKIVSYLVLWVIDWCKSLGVGCTFEEVGRESKMSKDECESFYNQIRMNNLIYFLRDTIP